MGVFLRGKYLGRQESSTYTPRGEDRKVNVRPKIGIEVDGEEIEVKCKDDDQMNALARGWVKGDVVELPVEVRPPFGSPRGAAVGFFAPGAIDSASRAEWR